MLRTVPCTPINQLKAIRGTCKAPKQKIQGFYIVKPCGIWRPSLSRFVRNVSAQDGEWMDKNVLETSRKWSNQWIIPHFGDLATQVELNCNHRYCRYMIQLIQRRQLRKNSSERITPRVRLSISFNRIKFCLFVSAVHFLPI